MINICILHSIPKLTEVHAILNWKYEQNGDGLIDVASLLLAFLDIGSYGVSIPQSIVYPGKQSQCAVFTDFFKGHFE